MRVLIADNNKSVRSALRYLLEERADVIVNEIDNSSAIGEKVDTIKHDLMIIDWELCQKNPIILSTFHSLNPATKIIVLSGRPETRQNAIEAGANYFINKGEPPEQLINALDNILCEKQEVKK